MFVLFFRKMSTLNLTFNKTVKLTWHFNNGCINLLRTFFLWNAWSRPAFLWNFTSPNMIAQKEKEENQ